MIKPERLKELIEKEATIYRVKYNKIFEIELKKGFFEDDDTSTICKFSVFDECLELNNDNGENEYAWLIEYLFETKSEAEFYAKYGNIEKTIKMPVPPTWEELKIKDFIKSNKTKPDIYKELFTFYLNNELFNLEIYSDENCKYFITISDDKNYYKPLFEMPLTKYNYYKALDKMVELWREEV